MNFDSLFSSILVHLVYWHFLNYAVKFSAENEVKWKKGKGQLPVDYW